MSEITEHVDLLLRKAGHDEFTIDKLISDPASPHEVIGFHAQQAIEKLLKAVLVHRSVSYRRTHDLVELLDLLRTNGLTYPPDLEDVRQLTPFATTFRYDELPDESEEPFDPAWARECVRRARLWAEAVIRGEES